MAGPLKLRSGILSGLPALAIREPAFTTDRPRLYVGSAAGNRLVGILEKVDATAAPGVNDDSGDGYSRGTRWVDTVTDKVYLCADDTVGAAVWTEVSSAGGIADGDTLATGLTFPNTGLKIRDTNDTHSLTVALGSNLTANRTLTLSTGDAARALNISAADVTVSTFGASLVDDANAAEVQDTIGGTTIGKALFTLANPSAIRYPRINADNSITALTAALLTADLSVLVAAGGTAAKGLAPAPGATSHVNHPWYLGDDAAYHHVPGVIAVAPAAADETTTANATPADLTTVQSVTFTLDAGGNVIVFGCANYYDTASAQSAFLYANVNGTDTAISGSTTNGANFLEMLVGCHYATLGAGAHTIKLRYLVAGGTGHFRWRMLIVLRAP